MPKGKRHTPEQIVAILRRAESGEAVAMVCRETNISAATFHRWKSHYGGMQLSELQQLRGLRDENARLKRLVADQALHIQVLKEVMEKNGEPGAETSGGRECGGSRPVHTPLGVPLLGAATLDVALPAAAADFPAKPTGKGGRGAVARSSSVRLSKDSCRSAPQGAEMCASHRPANPSPRRLADPRSGRAAQVPASA